MGTKRACVAVGATALLLLASPVAAGQFNPLGDGSDYENADLLRDTSTGCENCRAAPPYEWGDPPFDLEWSLGLRGGIVNDGAGEQSYEVIALPSVTLRHDTIRGSYDVGLSGELTYEPEGGAHMGSLTGTVGGEYRFDELTTLAGRATLNLSRDDPDDPSYPANVASTPLVVSGTGEVSLARDLGAFNLALRGAVGREINGETVLDDATTTDNSYRNTTSYGIGSRLGYALSPGIKAFADIDARYGRYDEPSPSLLVKLDNVTYAGRGGLNVKIGETLELEGSLGLGYRDFRDDSQLDFPFVLYDGRAVFRPDETLTLTGALTTTVSSPGATSGARAKTTYAALADVSYQVNPWLRLRADAEWSAAHYEGIDGDQRTWGAGVGADYLLNEHTDLTADYGFARTERTPNPATDKHQVTVGINLHR